MEERQEFIIDSPSKADWAVQKIKEERRRRDLFVEAANGSIERLREQIQAAAEKCDNETAFFISGLMGFFETVPAKKTKTQASFILPAGKLVRKFPKIEYQRDNVKLLEFLEASDPDLVKTKKDVDWAALKKDLLVQNGVVVRESTGEIIESITTTESPETFDVE